MVSEVSIRASDILEMRGCENSFADVLARSSVSPATADVEFCVIRRDSLAGLGFPFLSNKDRTTSELSSIQHWYDPQLDVTCLHSVAHIEVQVDALVRCQPCQGTCPAPRDGYRVVWR